MTWRLGVDVGGTFTDLVLAGETGWRVAKVPSTPQDQATGIGDGLARLDVSPGDLARFAHGTTVATNAVLERAGARVVLVTTAGFGDLLAIGRQDRPRLYDLAARRPAPVVERDRVVEVVERVGSDATVVTPLVDDEVRRVVQAVADLRPESVAISLLFGFLDDSHERRLAEALDDLGVPVTRASALLPVFREVERTSTVALNAYVAPVMTRYLGSLERRLGDEGLTVPVEVMRSGGGTFTARVASREPVHTLLSGPAAGAWGAAAIGALVGADRLLALDVGGTSTDVTLVEDGRPTTTAEGSIDGLPFAVNATDIHTIGAGGGSLAWRDDGGALRVGPRSAGAVPGPACYGRGGDQPTVTDANVVLGRLDPEVRLGGAMPLQPRLATEVVADLARQLGVPAERCAQGIVQVTDAQMVKALRVVSVERGRDPRRFDLVPFGGAGPLHQAALARELGCRRVLVPPSPGVLSAQGLLAAPVTVDRVRGVVRALADLHRDDVAAVWDELSADARREVAEQDVPAAAERRTADLRYQGQAFELEVAAEQPDLATLAAAFHRVHEERYGFAQPEAPVELVALRVRVEGPAPPLPVTALHGGGDQQHATVARRPVVDDGERVDAAIVVRERLGAGAVLQGPAVVVGLDATVWVAPWQSGLVEEHGLLVLEERPSN
ncbi:hydantoinase/oxoprolinase family protein [Egicoccus sp. AB-alg2]|uniref:hydantoinase/oxoprolinase family protein n=1 Tax=Egicoccus sp. AB-alg2 TaxID=3242693 RepID=UPI00359CE249